jgi:hypothetical protein
MSLISLLLLQQSGDGCNLQLKDNQQQFIIGVQLIPY